MKGYPQTRTDGMEEVSYGIKVKDPYRWLEDSDNPEVKKWVEEQNNHARTFIDKITVRKELLEKFKKIASTKYFSVPVPAEKASPSEKLNYYQFIKNPNQNFNALYLKQGLKGAPTLVLDPNKFSDDGSVTLYTKSFNFDFSKLAYATSKYGSDVTTIRVLDVKTNKTLEDVISNIRYPCIAWLNDDSGFYYCKWPDPKLVKNPLKQAHVYFHKLGTSQESDTEVFGKGFGTKKSVNIKTFPDNDYLIIRVDEWAKSEIYIKKNSETKPLITGEGRSYVIEIIQNTAYILTNKKAPNFKLISVDIKNPSEEKIIIPEAENTMNRVMINKKKIIIEYLQNACSKIKIFSITGHFLKEIPLPQFTVITGISGIRNSTEEFLFSSSSLASPYAIYKVNLENFKIEKIKETNYDFNFNTLELKQEWCESKDGTKIPLFIVSSKKLKLDGNNPLVLYGYGAYGINETPIFKPEILPFLEHGVYVHAILRGGGEFGEKWHKQGMFENKQNVFDDFISTTKWLLKKKYTNHNKIAICGNSNGGLLVSACMTQKPELFKTVICQVPITDMLRFHKFGGGAFWTTEYGNPENKKDFKYLIKYSPYHNVKRKKYPSLLIIAGDNDTITDPMHARKFAAIIQKNNTSNNPTLLLTYNSGHHPSETTIEKRAERNADTWAFIYKELKIT